MIRLDTEEIFPHIGREAFESRLPGALDELSSLVARSGAGSGMLGWLDLPKRARSLLPELDYESKRLQDISDALVVVGIGGSYLGARAAIEALPENANFPVYFAGNNLSPSYHARLLDTLRGKRFSVCVISKSGTTTEPAIAFRLLRRRLIDDLGKEGAGRMIVAVTDPSSGALRKMAAREGWKTFDIPPDVGGRFSVLSPVGLLPCAAAGIPLEDLTGGALSAMKDHTRADLSNLPVRYALARTMLHERGTAVEVLSTFNPGMAFFCEWWKQLAGESEGKEGKGLFPASTVMTTDLHSLGQLLQDGTRDILETFLVAASPSRELTVPEDRDDLDGLNYLAGRALGDINRVAFESTRSAHVSGGIPVAVIEADAIDPETVGGLFVFFEIAVAVSGRLLGLNPFDQPGVEHYKKRMFKLLGKPGA